MKIINRTFQPVSWEVKSAGASLPHVLGGMEIKGLWFPGKCYKSLVSGRPLCLISSIPKASFINLPSPKTICISRNHARNMAPKHTHTHTRIHTQTRVCLKPTGFSVNLMKTPCSCNHIHWVSKRGQRRHSYLLAGTRSNY